MDHYETLGLPRNASSGEIRSAFRRRVRTTHPDFSGEQDSARFRQVQEAYTVLSDPRQKAAYDRSLDQRVAVHFHPVRSRVPVETVYEVFPGRRQPFTTVEDISPGRPGAGDQFEQFADWILSLFRSRIF